MNSYQRVMAALKGEPFDCYPALSPTSVVTNQLMSQTNTSFPSAHLNLFDTVALAEAGHKILGFDSIAPYFSIHLEASALGAEIDWNGTGGMPQVLSKPLKTIENYTLPDGYLESKEIQLFVKIIEILHDKYHGTVPLIGKVVGPWTLAYHLFGVENLILKTILDPEETACFIKELSKCSLAFAKMQFEAGADFVVWAEHVTADLVSPDIYSEFVLPIHKNAVKVLKPYGPLMMHVCGNLSDRVGQLSQSGMALLHIDSRNDFKDATSQLQSKMQLVGFINNPHLLRNGSKEEVHHTAVHLLQGGVTFVAPECALPFTVPNSNLIELTKTLHSFTPVKIASLSRDE